MADEQILTKVGRDYAKSFICSISQFFYKVCKVVLSPLYVRVNLDFKNGFCIQGHTICE